MMGKDVLTVEVEVAIGIAIGPDLTTTTMTEVEVAIGTAIGPDLTTTTMTEVEVAIGTAIGPDLTTTAVKTRAGIRIGTIISPGITATATNNRLIIRMTATIKNYHNPTTLPPGLPPIPPEHQRHSAELKTAQDADGAEIQRFFEESAELQNTKGLFLKKVTGGYKECFKEERKQAFSDVYCDYEVEFCHV